MNFNNPSSTKNDNSFKSEQINKLTIKQFEDVWEDDDETDEADLDGDDLNDPEEDVFIDEDDFKGILPEDETLYKDDFEDDDDIEDIEEEDDEAFDDDLF